MQLLSPFSESILEGRIHRFTNGRRSIEDQLGFSPRSSQIHTEFHTDVCPLALNPPCVMSLFDLEKYQAKPVRVTRARAPSTLDDVAFGRVATSRAPVWPFVTSR